MMYSDSEGTEGTTSIAHSLWGREVHIGTLADYEPAYTLIKYTDKQMFWLFLRTKFDQNYQKIRLFLTQFMAKTEFTIKRCFSRSGYLPWRIRKIRSNK